MLGFSSISENPISSLIEGGGAPPSPTGTINMFHNDKAFRYLGTLGWHGSYNDRLHAFLSDNLSREGGLEELIYAYVKSNGKLI